LKSTGACTFDCYELNPSQYRNKESDRFVNVTTSLRITQITFNVLKPKIDSNDFQRVFKSVLDGELSSHLNDFVRYDGSTSTSTISVEVSFPYDVTSSLGWGGAAPHQTDFTVDLAITVDQAYYEDIASLVTSMTVATASHTVLGGNSVYCRSVEG
jgi:hypothetical protein